MVKDSIIHLFITLFLIHPTLEEEKKEERKNVLFSRLKKTRLQTNKIHCSSQFMTLIQNTKRKNE
jgi:hypothetical protein